MVDCQKFSFEGCKFKPPQNRTDLAENGNVEKRNIVAVITIKTGRPILWSSLILFVNSHCILVRAAGWKMSESGLLNTRQEIVLKLSTRITHTQIVVILIIWFKMHLMVSLFWSAEHESEGKRKPERRERGEHTLYYKSRALLGLSITQLPHTVFTFCGRG